MNSFFGEALLEIEPDLFRTSFDFDDDSWMLLYRYPKFLAKRLYRSKDAAIDAMTR